MHIPIRSRTDFSCWLREPSARRWSQALRYFAVCVAGKGSFVDTYEALADHVRLAFGEDASPVVGGVCWKVLGFYLTVLLVYHPGGFRIRTCRDLCL